MMNFPLAHFPRLGALGNQQSRKTASMQVCLGDGSRGWVVHRY